jgi:hypothetical protein
MLDNRASFLSQALRRIDQVQTGGKRCDTDMVGVVSGGCGVHGAGAGVVLGARWVDGAGQDMDTGTDMARVAGPAAACSSRCQ